MSASSRPPQAAWRGQQRAFLLNADQHRRLAAMLRRATTPDHEQQAAHHEQLADAIDRQQRQAEETRRLPLFITIPSIDLSTWHVVEINELTKPIYSGPKEAAEFVSNGLNRSPIATYEEEDSVELRKKIEADHDATIKALLVSFFRGPNSGPKHRKTA